MLSFRHLRDRGGPKRGRSTRWHVDLSPTAAPIGDLKPELERLSRSGLDPNHRLPVQPVGQRGRVLQ